MTALARLRPAVRRLADDPQYRGSAMLLANTALLSAFGFVFWTVAARLYPSAEVGSFSALSSSVVLLSVVAALGLPNTLTRHLVASAAARRLVASVLGVVTLLGGVATAVVVLVAGPHLPETLLPERGGGGWLLVALVVLTAAGAVTDAGLITTRSTGAMLVKNLVGSVAKVVVLVPLTGLGSAGLVLAFGTGVALSALLGLLLLWRRLGADAEHPSPVALLRRHGRFSTGSYVGTVFGILPLAGVPIIVLAERGAREAAWWSVAAMLVSFLNFIPSTSSQVLFAEVSREPGRLRTQVAKALRGIYVLMLPALLLLVVAAPLVLLVFGAEYRDGATAPLRVLAVSALFTGGTYVVDSILVARDRVGAYIFMNAANAALVLGGTAALLSGGLAAGALGWLAAQAASLVIGVVVLAISGLRPQVRVTVGRRPTVAARTPTR